MASSKSFVRARRDRRANGELHDYAATCAYAPRPRHSHQELQTSRPLTHRPPIPTTQSSASLITRQTHTRTNSYSALSASLNASHRVTRRKSMTSSAANAAAVAAALSGATELIGEKTTVGPVAISGRRNTLTKSGISRAMMAASLPTEQAGSLSVPSKEAEVQEKEVNLDMLESAIDDEPLETLPDNPETPSQDGRMRRASDGQPLVKEGGSRKINRVELRCDKWEHTPEWSYTSKLLISKHQQVQLLEAASVLVTMNNVSETTTPPEQANDYASDRDSASPAASGYSELMDGRSSADTTPPPQLDGSYNIISKRYSNGSGFGRSYQSAVSVASLASSAPNGHGLGHGGHFRQLSQEHRPPSSGKNATGQEDQDLAAAVELLSCSFNSNNGHRAVHLPPDAPPVPPLPAQYLEQATGAGFINSFPRHAPESFLRGSRLESEMRHRGDVNMEESADSTMDDDDDDSRYRARSEDDDDGVFGRMEVE
ncbi:hypothetical protein PpBr36_00457 [Pyricularia pennisetigena]|uniref:hypothetical protein n=1 Tax=Pyricularia pennisetigena TaxID=1578925 RepID=UPI001151480C|nr:hypothetical protein PpBr36_00457 [Pyricularia pennisetigena]TLS29773.1 hypothetical protein PpBr36_00457 [Pyricularia pennisetigena]